MVTSTEKDGAERRDSYWVFRDKKGSVKRYSCDLCGFAVSISDISADKRKQLIAIHTLKKHMRAMHRIDLYKKFSRTPKMSVSDNGDNGWKVVFRNDNIKILSR